MSAAYYLNILVNIIANTYYQDNCLLIFRDNSSYLLSVQNIPSVNILIHNETVDEEVVFKHYGCQNFVIHVSEPLKIFFQIENYIKLGMVRFNSRKYLFLATTDMENAIDNINLPALEYVSNILIISAHKRTGNCKAIVDILCKNEYYFNLKTQNYIGQNHTHVEVLLDMWFPSNYSFLWNNNLYPDKISDQQGRPLRIATFTYKPYSIVGDSLETSDGTEMRIALEYSRKHNASVELIVDQEGEWGLIYDNWTGVGILGNLAMDKADIGLAALYTWEHEYHFLDLSHPLVRTGITCLVPAPRLAPGWITPLVSFSKEMWLAVLACLLISSISLFGLLSLKAKSSTWKIINKKNKTTSHAETSGAILEEIFLKVFGMFLLQSLPTSQLLRDKHIRILLSCVFLLTLLLATSYNSGLASAMTVPRYVGAIHTVDDLVASGLHWGATQDAWIFSILDAKEEKYVKLVNRFVAAKESELKKLGTTRKFAFSIERLPAANFAIGNYINEENVQALRIMNEDIYWELCVIMTRKSSHLLPSFNSLILRIAESGLPAYWELEVTAKYSNLKTQRTIKFSRHEEKQSEPKKLKWVHVEGAFAFWALGLIFSSICFICELKCCICKN